MPGNQRGSLEDLMKLFIASAKECRDEGVPDDVSIAIIQKLGDMVCTAITHGSYELTGVHYGHQ